MPCAPSNTLNSSPRWPVMATEPTTLGGALSLARGEVDRGEARVLLQSVTGHTTSYLVAHPEATLSAVDMARFSLLARRIAGEPVAYLIGWREFYGRRFRVTEDVLIPRPETELIVDVARELCASPPSRALDLGTGSGALAVTLALQWPESEIVAVDQSAAALAVATGNANALGARVNFAESDWFDALHATAPFWLVVANPPYVASGDAHLRLGDVKYEPRTALVAGEDGLDDIRRIVSAAPSHLHRGAWLLIEHGYDQAAAVRELLRSAGFFEPASWCDLAGIERVSGASLAA